MIIPKLKDPELAKFFVEWDRDIEANRRNMLSAITANHSLLLISSGLKVWEVTVDDAGALHTTKVAG